jgi:hypothetical protein
MENLIMICHYFSFKVLTHNKHLHVIDSPLLQYLLIKFYFAKVTVYCFLDSNNTTDILDSVFPKY